MTIRSIEGIPAGQIQFELERGGSGEGVAVDPAHLACRMVGDSVGADLHRAIAGGEPQGGKDVTAPLAAQLGLSPSQTAVGTVR
jgi:hypothetical protein